MATRGWYPLHKAGSVQSWMTKMISNHPEVIGRQPVVYYCHMATYDPDTYGLETIGINRFGWLALHMRFSAAAVCQEVSF